MTNPVWPVRLTPVFSGGAGRDLPECTGRVAQTSAAGGRTGRCCSCCCLSRNLCNGSVHACRLPESPPHQPDPYSHCSADTCSNTPEKTQSDTHTHTYLFPITSLYTVTVYNITWKLILIQYCYKLINYTCVCWCVCIIKAVYSVLSYTNISSRSSIQLKDSSAW